VTPEPKFVCAYCMTRMSVRVLTGSPLFGTGNDVSGQLSTSRPAQNTYWFEPPTVTWRPVPGTTASGTYDVVYWTNGPDESPANGSALLVPKSTPSALATGGGAP